MANSVDPDQRPHSAVCSGLSVPILRVIRVCAKKYWKQISICRENNEQCFLVVTRQVDIANPSVDGYFSQETG